jgi:hypothetical protein
VLIHVAAASVLVAVNVTYIVGGGEEEVEGEEERERESFRGRETV